MIKDQIYFILGRNKGVEDGKVREQPDSWSNDELLCGDERWQCGDCSEMRRLDVEGSLFGSLSVLGFTR